MRKFFNWFSSVFAILFAIPSFFILTSWNALPGDTLYTIKTGLEDIALAISIRTPVASAFSINFTQRRFSEANRLLAKKGSTLGYTLLVAEAKESQQIIVEQKDPKKGAELVAKIEEYQKSIEEKRQAIVAQPSFILPSPSPTTKETKIETPAPIQVPTPLPISDVVLEDLKQTNKELEEIKQEIKRDLPESASEKAKENLEEHRDREKSSKDRPNE